MSDEPDRQDLEDRVDQLETTIAKMLPGRRDALKLGGAALLGGAAMSGSASAGGNEAGTIGTSGAPVDVESEDINNADTVTTANLDAETANIENLGAGRHFAGSYSGANATTRLTNAISDASDGDTVFLENASYGTLTISKPLCFVGTAGLFREGTKISGDWTFNEQTQLQRVYVVTSTITFNKSNCKLTNSQGEIGNVQVNENDCFVTGCMEFDVTFASGTARGIADSLVRSSVTDNGNNTVGDIS
jgi:hypothetical protein